MFLKILLIYIQYYAQYVIEHIYPSFYAILFFLKETPIVWNDISYM